MNPPPADRQKRPKDGISWVQKVATVEIGFRGALGCFQGMEVYIGEGGRSGEPRGWGRALLPRGRLVASLTSTPSLLDCVCSKKGSSRRFRSVWTLFDIPFLRNTEIGKKTAICTGPSVNRLVPKII